MVSFSIVRKCLQTLNVMVANKVLAAFKINVTKVIA